MSLKSNNNKLMEFIKNPINEMLIISDLDGTLIPAWSVISEKNIKAIEKFRSLGGIFTVASGRSEVHALDHLGKLKISGAAILSNGSVIFDVDKGKNLWCQVFEPSAINFLTDIIRKFPDVGIVLIDINNLYCVINATKRTLEYLESICPNGGYTVCKKLELPENCKSGWLDLNSEEEMKELILHYVNSGCKDVRPVVSGDMWMDILPGGVSKGSAINRLCEIYDRDISKTVGIGDYDNDIELISNVGLGVAMGNATKTLLKKADVVTSTCEEDGVAELIEFLIENSAR